MRALRAATTVSRGYPFPPLRFTRKTSDKLPHAQPFETEMVKALLQCLSPQSCLFTRQHPRIENVNIYQAVQKKEKTSHKYTLYKKGGEILGCYDFSATSPSTGASSSAAVDLVARVCTRPLLPSSFFQAARRRHLVATTS